MDGMKTVTIGAIVFATATTGRGAQSQPEEGTPIYAAGVISSVADDPFARVTEIRDEAIWTTIEGNAEALRLT
jgi:hypothetical protein